MSNRLNKKIIDNIEVIPKYHKQNQNDKQNQNQNQNTNSQKQREKDGKNQNDKQNQNEFTEAAREGWEKYQEQYYF
jgi:hypothetical protein